MKVRKASGDGFLSDINFLIGHLGIEKPIEELKEAAIE